MDGAAETSVDGGGWGVVCDALSVVKLPTHRNHAAAHVLASLLTHKAGVDACRSEGSVTGSVDVYTNNAQTQTPPLSAHKHQNKAYLTCTPDRQTSLWGRRPERCRPSGRLHSTGPHREAAPRSSHTPETKRFFEKYRITNH